MSSGFADDYAAEGDLSTDVGFDAAFSAAVQSSGSELADELVAEESGDAAPAEEPSSRPRDPETGRFLPADEVAETPAEETPSEVGEEETPQELTAEATRLAEAQKLIGRQGQELGEARKRLEELEARLAKVEETPEPPPVAITPDVVEALEGMVEEHGGLATFQWAIQNQPELVDAVFQTWIEQDGAPAIMFRQDYQTELLRQELEEKAQAAAPPPPSPEQTLQSVIADVKKATPDFDGLDIVSAAQGAPKAIQELLQSDNPAHQKDAVETLVLIARASGAPKSPSSSASAAAKAAAQVATGALRPADADSAPEKSPDDVLRDSILGQQAASVAAGLTFS